MAKKKPKRPAKSVAERIADRLFANWGQMQVDRLVLCTDHPRLPSKYALPATTPQYHGGFCREYVIRIITKELKKGTSR